MLAAAADAVAALSDATTVGASLLPSVDQLRMVSAAVGVGVAEAAGSEGLAKQISITQSSRFMRRCGGRHIRRLSWRERDVVLGRTWISSSDTILLSAGRSVGTVAP